MSSTVYQVEDLVKRYPGTDRPANDRLSFTVERGEIFGILGDNGAGKSTLVRQMVDLLRPTSGIVRFEGEPLAPGSLAVARRVGFMPQESDALNHLTVAEALYFTAHLRGLDRAAARRARDEALVLWGLEALADRDTATLSGGERRLTRLAVAAAGWPPVLVLDEPTNDLDPLRRRRVWDLLRRLQSERGTTVIFITHDTVEAEKVIERVGILHRGRMVALGRPAELKRRVGRRLKIELRFDPDRPPALPPDLDGEHLDPGRWTAHADWDQACELIARLDPATLEDFRMQWPTLEDLYLSYVGE